MEDRGAAADGATAGVVLAGGDGRSPLSRKAIVSLVAHGVTGAVVEWWHSRYSDRVSRAVGDDISVAAHIGRPWSHWISLHEDRASSAVLVALLHLQRGTWVAVGVA